MALGIYLSFTKKKDRSRQRISTIPGLDPTDDELGNIPDISRHGSFHSFILDVHKRMGPIVSFWYNKNHCVSIASAPLFKEVQHMFDRPPVFFEFLTPITTKKAIQFANGPDGRAKHKLYSEAFAHSNCVKLLPKFNDTCCELTKHWQVRRHSASTEGNF